MDIFPGLASVRDYRNCCGEKMCHYLNQRKKIPPRRLSLFFFVVVWTLNPLTEPRRVSLSRSTKAGCTTLSFLCEGRHTTSAVIGTEGGAVVKCRLASSKKVGE